MTEDLSYSSKESLKLKLMDLNFANKRYRKLVELFSGSDPGDKERKLLIEQLSGRYTDKTANFLDEYERLGETVYGNKHARDFLSKELGGDREHLKDCKNPVGFLLKFYELRKEKGADITFDEFRLHIETFQDSRKYEYYLQKEIDLKDIGNRVDNYISNHNRNKDHRIRVEHKKEDEGHFFHLYAEYGRGYERTFKFRKEGKKNPEGRVPEPDGFSYHPLKSIKLELEELKDEIKITFSTDPKRRHKSLVESFFKGVFNIEEIFAEFSTKRSEVVSAVHDYVGEAIQEEDVEPENIDRAINRNSEEIVERIDVDEDEEDRIKDFLEDAKFAGFRLSDDEKTQWDDFTAISSEISDAMMSAEDLKQGFSSLFDEANLDNVEVIIDLNGDKISIDGKRWKSVRGGVTSKTKQKLKTLDEF